MRIDPSNVDQMRSWDGADGMFWAAREDYYNAGVAGYHGTFLDAAEIKPTDNVLDIGCGNGLTTRDAARRAIQGEVVGVDLSAEMLANARRRAAAEDVSNAAFVQADAQIHDFPARHFDLAISRNGAMFFGDPVAAFDNIGRALRPGGRLVLLAWQPLADNEWLTTFRSIAAQGRVLPEPPTDRPGPFSLSEPDRVRRLLTEAGFRDVYFDDLREPMCFGRDVEDALQFAVAQAGGLFGPLDDEQRAKAVEELRASFEAHQTERGVCLGSASWLITARRD